MKKTPNDWNPRAPHVLENQLASYDQMRQKCPVAHSDYLHWSVFRHEEVVRALEDHQTFSSAVSAHVSVPNSMDPPEHTLYRKIIEPYFSADAMTAFEPACRALATKLVADLPREKPLELITQFAQGFALQVQCEFLGWPADTHEPLRRWMYSNHTATLSGDRTATAAVAQEFTDLIKALLQRRGSVASTAPEDVITRLMRSEVNGRVLSEEEIVSILRNWTGGEVGTIAAAVGIIIQFLSQHPALQNELRADLAKLPEAIDEILRLHGPLVANRRVTTCPVEIGGRQIAAGERLSLFWVSANRDEQVFEDAHSFRWGRDPKKNLLYGAGIHVCPGASLARMELRILMEELLKNTRGISLLPEAPKSYAQYPASGFSELHIVIR